MLHFCEVSIGAFCGGGGLSVKSAHKIIYTKEPTVAHIKISVGQTKCICVVYLHVCALLGHL